MLVQIKRSVFLLVFLAVLFAIPIATKTVSAHGVIPAIVTGLLAAFAVLLGPLAFFVAPWLETELVFADAALSKMQWLLLSGLGLGIVSHWCWRASRHTVHTFPYTPVVAWALAGVTFCLVHLFVHVG